MTVLDWREIDTGYLAGVAPDAPGDTDNRGLCEGLRALGRGQSYLAWCTFRSAAVLLERILADGGHLGTWTSEGHRECAARIAAAQGISQRSAEILIDRAVALRDRLPQIAVCLRDGLISPTQAGLIISRTELIETDDAAREIDSEISTTLRNRPGQWSRARLRDLCDRVVFRHDPDSVRRRRRKALAERGIRTENLGDGVAEIAATMSAENVRIAAAAVAGLADAACKGDPRTRRQRASDAIFALLSGTRFACGCHRDDCPATIPDPGTVPPADAKIVIHVVCDEGTLAGTAANAGFVDGHGVISDEQVRELAARPDARIAPLTDGPAHLPSEPYRPSTALDTFIRVRDGYCTTPGCDRPAWQCDLDHVREYDHAEPAAGGQTTPEGLNAKCRGDHLRKTFADWVDDQFRDADGLLRTRYLTPDGMIVDGYAATNEDLFPGLRTYRFETLARTAHPAPAVPISPPPRRRRFTDRLKAKHARRQAERRRNRAERDREEQRVEAEKRIGQQREQRFLDSLGDSPF